MTTSYTALLGLAQPATGDLSGTWGTTVNDNITAYLDSAIAGTQIISGSLTAVTLSKTTGASLSQAGTGSTGSSQYQIIRCTGNPASLLTITAPAADKTYIIINATSTSQSVKIVGVGPTTGITILSGKTSLVAWNGSDFVEVSPNTISGVLAIANGGTGATTLAGAKIPVWDVANTFTGTQTFTGTSSTLAEVLTNAAETTTVSATAATGTINFDVTTQSVLFYTSNASANWTVNVRASSGTTLNTALATNQSITIAFLVTQGATAYYNNAFTIDGTSVTPKWQGGSAPTSGNASGVDVYTYTIVKTASATFTVLASQTQFK